MEVLLYISVAAIAVAFIVLVFYVISTLKRVSKTLEDVSETVTNVQSQLKGVLEETETMVKRTSSLAEDIQKKSEKLDPLLDSINGLGKTVQNFNKSLEGISKGIIGKVDKNKEKISQIVQLGTVIWGLKDRWAERKEEKQQMEKLERSQEREFH